MKTLPLLICAVFLASYTSLFAEEFSNKEGIKTGAETVINGAALIGITGAMSEHNQPRSYEGRKASAKTWAELGGMHRAARPAEAEFGK